MSYLGWDMRKMTPSPFSEARHMRFRPLIVLVLASVATAACCRCGSARAHPGSWGSVGASNTTARICGPGFWPQAAFIISYRSQPLQRYRPDCRTHRHPDADPRSHSDTHANARNDTICHIQPDASSAWLQEPDLRRPVQQHLAR